MGIYFIDILDGGEFWAAVLDMHIHTIVHVCLFFWFLVHVLACASLASAVSGRDNGEIFSRGVIHMYGLNFLPTPPRLDFVRGSRQTTASFMFNVVCCHHFRLTTPRFEVVT